jgi:hypothetical protein
MRPPGAFVCREEFCTTEKDREMAQMFHGCRLQMFRRDTQNGEAVPQLYKNENLLRCLKT